MLVALFLIVTTLAIDCPGGYGDCRPASSPVCGYYQSGSSKTFADDCIACQSPGITSYTIGQCFNFASLALALANVPGRNQNQPVILTDQQVQPTSSATGGFTVNGSFIQSTTSVTSQNPAIPTVNTNDGLNFNEGIQTASRIQPQQNTGTTTDTTTTTSTTNINLATSGNIPTPTLIPEPQAPPAPAVNVNFQLNVPECRQVLASCQRQFSPVCGTLKDGLRITFANACTACQFAGLLALNDGSCAPLSTTQASNPPTPLRTNFTPMTSVSATYTPSTPIATTFTPTTTVSATYTPSTPLGTQLAQPTQSVSTTQTTFSNTTSTVQRIVISEPPPKLTGTSFQPVTNTWVGCAQTNPTACPYSYRPVCGMKNDLRRQSFSNPCNACADKTVVSYKLGACSSAQTRQNSVLATPCPKTIGFCSPRYVPVCAYYKNGTSKTASNSCYACLQSGIVAFRNNACAPAGGIITGGKPRSELCGNNPTQAILCLLQQNLLCGVLSSGRTRTYNNGCEACQDPQMASYTVGKCRN